MKNSTLFILFIFYLSIQSFSQDYLKIIFKNKEDIPTSDKKADSVIIKFHDEKLNDIFKKYKISKFEKEYPIADSFPDYMTPAVRLRLVYQVWISRNKKDQIKELKQKMDEARSPDIDTVLETDNPISLGTPPNDYYNCFACTGGLWAKAYNHLDLINALGAWEITKGLSCIKIGLSDENFQHHLDLDNKVDITPRTVSIDAASSTFSHGIAVAGMAGAETDNNVGISSLGYNVRLLYYDRFERYNSILNAIYDGCKVVNCSWGTSYSTLQTPPPDVQDVLTLARLNNVTIVAAAGNENSTNYYYPASYDGVISVTSVGSQFNVGDPNNINWKDCHRINMDPTKSNYNQTHQHNDRVDICAPGQGVETTGANNYYIQIGGTSLASPLVSAAAALLYSINPFFTTAEIEAYLKDNAADISGVQDNYLWAGKLGAGRLDVKASLQAALSKAYTGNYCNSCPLETTYLTASGISGYFYDKNIYAGSNNGNVVSTSNSISTTLVATNSIVLTREFTIVATANSSFSARIQPCITTAGRAISNDTVIAKGVDILNKKEQIKIYPNPTNDIITVTCSYPNIEQLNIEILNNVGAVVKRIQKNAGKTASYKTEIDVRNLQAGLYYIVFKSFNKTYTNKFVKIR